VRGGDVARIIAGTRMGRTKKKKKHRPNYGKKTRTVVMLIQLQRETTRKYKSLTKKRSQEGDIEAKAHEKEKK